LSDEEKQERAVLLLSARAEYEQRMRDENWGRRRPLLLVLAGGGFRPLEYKRLVLELARAALDSNFTMEIPPVIIRTQDERRAHLLGLIFSNEGMVRLICSFL